MTDNGFYFGGRISMKGPHLCSDQVFSLTVSSLVPVAPHSAQMHREFGYSKFRDNSPYSILRMTPIC